MLHNKKRQVALTLYEYMVDCRTLSFEYRDMLDSLDDKLREADMYETSKGNSYHDSIRKIRDEVADLRDLYWTQSNDAWFELSKYRDVIPDLGIFKDDWENPQRFKDWMKKNFNEGSDE